ncbi:MAG: glutamine--tRNA ligase/YqeY domain fusion protein [Clostridium argentinense]|uniref:glutamine--tRNA ligase/YqeY domain fusion protein n=1 Tax=uncultured Clostridium sp. TaxID=59620 RepID=UPI001DCC0C92|nr:glutamine--tRNA ligase/YqeY domain fusion protein [uncultured Clostridium sp.]MBS5823027.1 glutamine--tRNA ligase/YqeY domain fusion protein [Clostridium argentinense]MDU1349185.1 glutamine--tRNA ligase/YqeY domain fusion protein [Clostridium argentinense]
MCHSTDKNENIIIENFIDKVVEKDIKNRSFIRDICTRFPPEPNGYLHIGNAYAISVSYGIANKYGGKFNLRFDDTNPLKEDMEYVHSIIEDMKWIGFDPEDRIYYGSDYSDIIYEFAIKLIKCGKAYVCDLTPEKIREYRGTLTTAGKNSPYRNRTIEENLDLFERMKNGEFPTASKVLRAKIDMASPNINLRDPVIYRINFAHHYRTGDKWCIYPMYDFAHPLQDAIEGVTHSLCSIEFKNHRPLYEWFLKELDIKEPPKQREFGRLNLTGVVTSKRYLRELVFGGYVDGWDDPRLPTLKGLRRRGITPESIKDFLSQIGVFRNESTIDISLLEHTLRQDLKSKVNCVMGVLNPLKVTITNYDENKVEYLEIENNSENPSLGARLVPFSKTLYIEREDFMENPIKGFRRLSPGKEVRLKGAYFIKCEGIIKDPSTGEITELLCSYDPETKSGSGFTGRKVKGTIHWVSANHGIKAEVHLYDKLISDEELLKDNSKSWEERINPTSLIKLKNCILESSLNNAPIESKYQFIRHGYFCVDKKYSSDKNLVFNRIVPLKDSWNKKL